MDLAPQPSALKLEMVPSIGADESLRITVEAHSQEVVGVVPAYEDVAVVVTVLILFVFINAIWSAQDGSWLGLIRKALAGDRIDSLFIGINLKQTSAPQSALNHGRHAYLTALSKRTADVYAEEPLGKGDLVTIESKEYGELSALVRSCHPVRHEGGWYHMRLRLKNLKVGTKSTFRAANRAVTVAAVMLLLATSLVAAVENPQSVMTALLEPLTRVLELSFDREEFASIQNRAAVETQLARLVQAASNLEEHAKSRERGFEFVARSLGRDLRETQRAYKRGDFENARRSLHNLTDNCVACHTSLAEGRQLPPSERFFSSLRTKSLPPLAIAHYQLVTRQFDAALATFEKVFSAPGAERALLPLMGFFGDYLKVSISIKNDFERPRRLLSVLVERHDTPMHLRGLFKTWIDALEQIQRTKPFDSISLENARKLINQGRALMDSATDRAGLIHYLTAEGVLLRFLKSRPDHGLDVATANYLLGNAVSLSEHSLWISRAPFYYESAIRTAPEAPFALKAYAALQDRLYSEAVLDGRPMDPESLFLLDELNEIIEDAQVSAKKI